MPKLKYTRILNAAMKVQKPSYSEVLALSSRLCVRPIQSSSWLIKCRLSFEHEIPYRLRCRAAYVSMPSRYPDARDAVEASPEPSRRAMAMSFQVKQSRPPMLFSLTTDSKPIWRLTFQKRLLTFIDLTTPKVSTRTLQLTRCLCMRHHTWPWSNAVE